MWANWLVVLAIMLSPQEAVCYWADYYDVPERYALCIAQKESGMNPDVLGDFHMGEPSYGLYQFRPETREYAERKAGKGPGGWENSPSEQARLAMYLMGVEGRWGWWHTNHLCENCGR